jgi:hypothetical protein
MHTFDADASVTDTLGINGLTIICPAESAIESRSLLEYSINEKT